MYFECHICKERKPNVVKEEHHYHIQAAGGVDDETYLICNTCHDNVHKVATMFLNKKKAGMINDVIDGLYKNDEPKTIFKDFVKTVVIDTIRKRTGQIEEDKLEKIRYKVMLDFDLNIKKGIQILARERKFSMKEFMEKLIIREVLSKFPNLK